MKDFIWEQGISTERGIPIHKIYTEEYSNTIYLDKKYKYQYQCLLESQADYILDNAHWWKETNYGIEFFDISNAPKSTMQLAHFRLTSIQGQLNYVKKCWNQLLLLKEKIPAFQIQLREENWDGKYCHWTFKFGTF